MDADNKIQLRPINIGKDYGTTLEVLGGVSIGDQVLSTHQTRWMKGKRSMSRAALQGQDDRDIRAPRRTRQQENLPRATTPGAEQAKSEVRGWSKQCVGVDFLSVFLVPGRMHSRAPLCQAICANSCARCMEDATTVAASCA